MRSTTARFGKLSANLAALLAVCTLGTAASAGVLLDYGADHAALNDAGVVRHADNPSDSFGFAQFQLFGIEAADDAWRIDRVSVDLRAWNTVSGAAGTLAVYRASGLEPAEKVSEDFSLASPGIAGETITVDLGGLVLDAGFYFIGIAAASAGDELLWLAGDESAFRTARRSDGGLFTGSPRALSLMISGEAVPGPAGVGVLGLAGLVAVRRRR